MTECAVGFDIDNTTAPMNRPPSPWADLRKAVEAERDARRQNAADYEETTGSAWQADMAYGGVDALEWVLTEMARLTPDNPAT